MMSYCCRIINDRVIIIAALFVAIFGHLTPLHFLIPNAFVYAKDIIAVTSENIAVDKTIIFTKEDPVDIYMKHLETLVQLLNSDLQSITSEELISKGREAYTEALKALPDETVPHVPSLFAKLCVKVGIYDEAIELFDEAIRRTSLSLDRNHDVSVRIETEELIDQLQLERRRTHNKFIEHKVLMWDAANKQGYNGGIPPETSPFVPLEYVELQLSVFPLPHPQTLFEKATLITLTLDSPEDEIKEKEMKSDNNNALNATARAWDAYEIYQKSQTIAYDAYLLGKKRSLAGGLPCEDLIGGELLVGGTAWSQHALKHGNMKSSPFAYDKTKAVQNNDLYMGIVTLENVIISGRDAVISGYQQFCSVFVRHPYVNLPNNIPMVTSWELPISEIKVEDKRKLLETYIPEGDTNAYGGVMSKKLRQANDALLITDPRLGGVIGKDGKGNDVMFIPNSRANNTWFDSAILLTGYASTNYFHFITEVLPSLVVMRNRIKDITKDDRKKTKDGVIIPNLHHDFVEGFMRLLLPEVFNNNGELLPHIVEWGPGEKPKGKHTSIFTSTHPIAYAQRLVTVIWDQPEEAPPPLSGPAHCLTPAPLLRAMQRVVLKSVDDMAPTPRSISWPLPVVTAFSKRIVYCSRSLSATRRLAEEDELISKLRQIADKEDAELVIFQKEAATDSAKDSSPLSSVTDAIKLFRSATVVVGVHGASLANIAFCQNCSVVEMGFNIPQAGHYLHLANSLELNYVGIRLQKDSRSFGATEVSVGEGGVDEVANAVIEGLKQEDGIGGDTEL